MKIIQLITNGHDIIGLDENGDLWILGDELLQDEKNIHFTGKRQWVKIDIVNGRREN